MGDGPHPDPPSTRGNTYRRIGVRACRRLHTVRKLTSANGSRLTFCGRQNSKCKISWQRGNVLEGQERIGVSACRREEARNTHLRFQVQMSDLRKRVEPTGRGSKTFRISSHGCLPEKTKSERFACSHTPTPSQPSNTPTLPYADTFFLPPIRSPAAAT